MKFECPRKELLEALNLVGSAASPRSPLPILTSLRLEAAQSGLTILGCDGEIWAERKILAAVETPGAICVSAALLKDVVASLPDGQLTFDTEGTWIIVRQGASEYRIPIIPVDDFPLIPPVQQNSSLTLTMGELRVAVDSVAYAAAEDQSRPQLTGVLFSYDGATLTLAATDTHRLAVCRITKEGIGEKMQAIVPTKALRIIKNLPVEDETPITLMLEEQRMGVDLGDSKVVTQLLSGVFPDWERVVPKEFTKTWTLDRGELLDNVKRTMVIAKEAAFRIKFSAQGDHIELTARAENNGEAKEQVSAVANDGDMEIAFNGKFVQDALAALRSDGIKAELTEASRPAVFRPIEGGENQFCVIMPMSLT